MGLSVYQIDMTVSGCPYIKRKCKLSRNSTKTKPLGISVRHRKLLCKMLLNNCTSQDSPPSWLATRLKEAIQYIMRAAHILVGKCRNGCRLGKVWICVHGAMGPIGVCCYWVVEDLPIISER